MITLAGCNSISTTSPSELPLMGYDPLYHTIYKGSDQDYHYFIVSTGLSSKEYRIPKNEASISPELNELNSKGKFIKEIKGTEIQLLIPRQQPKNTKTNEEPTRR